MDYKKLIINLVIFILMVYIGAALSIYFYPDGNPPVPHSGFVLGGAAMAFLLIHLIKKLKQVKN